MHYALIRSTAHSDLHEKSTEEALQRVEWLVLLNKVPLCLLTTVFRKIMRLMDKSLKTSTPMFVGGIVGGLLLIGALPLPYPYYSFLKLVVVASAVTLCICAAVRNKHMMIIPLGIIGLFFLAMKGLPKEVWAIIDVVAAVVMVGIGSFLSNVRIEDA